ncbi:MAG: glycosyltransferase family 2 protein [Sphingobacteriales bacterium]|nr:glycosyltransferase family 2 protein [Sphingobacteriales bacterium]
MREIPEISIVVPVFNEDKNIDKLFQEVSRVFREKIRTSFEIIFVDDGSTDSTWGSINCLADDHPEVRGIRFTRNFGHQYAIKAGLDAAAGQAVVSMDADLQHPPDILADFYRHWKLGYDIVYARRKANHHAGFLKNLTSRLYYSFINSISDTRIEEGVSDFRLLDRKVVNELKNMNEYFLFLRGMVQWTGFKSFVVDYEADKRFSGKTKFTLKKMISLAINGITSFSVRPLRIATLSGILVSVIAFVYIIYALIAKFMLHNALPGWTSILISVLFLGGIQLITIGILGEYIGKMFMEIKQRPKYIVREKREPNFYGSQNQDQ